MNKFQNPNLKFQTNFRIQNLLFFFCRLTFFTTIMGLINFGYCSDTLIQKIVVHFFYSPDCGHCMDILLDDIPRLQNLYQFQLKKYDLNNLDNYKLLEQMEKEKNIKNIGEDLPIVFIGNSAFYGPDEVRNELESTIKRYTGQRLIIKKDTSGVKKQDSLQVETGKIYLYYFYQPACPECNRAEALLNGLSKKYLNLIVYRYNILEDTNKIFYEGLAEVRNIPDDKRLIVPAIFVGDDYLIREISSGEIENLTKKYSGGSLRLDTLRISMAEKNIIKRFTRFSLLGVIFAGLLDGINPCAFATIIFFVSYLLFMGRKKRTVIIMSISFILAVFLCYLAIGLGAYIILNTIVAIKIIGRIIFLSFGIFAIILGVLSLYDYFVVRTGKTNKMILQLPLIVKQRIHKEIKERTDTGGIIIGSFVAGILISFLEFGCTGQVYFPTITFVVSRANLGLKPFLLLLIYDIMFILPLIIIAIVAGTISRDSVANFLSKRIPVIKILTAILFFVLGILLLLS
jgi:cytochrome c biogenesis protein CcdA/glutaredoxin